MGDFSHDFSPTPGGAANPNMMMPQDRSRPPGVGGPSPPVPAAFSGIGYFTAFHDPMMFSVPKTQSQPVRNRRKSTSVGLDAVKHRRTRSGCFMCRSRRVKCDEARPICERCRKGMRECIYPDLSSSKPPATQGGARDGSLYSQMTSPGSSTGVDEAEQEADSRLDPIPDEGEDLEEPEQGGTASSAHTSSPSPHFTKSSTRYSSESPSFEGSRGSPSGSTGSSGLAPPNLFSTSDPAFQPDSPRSDWSHLPADYQYYLNSFCENITHYDYCFVTPTHNFFSTILPNVAVRYEPLLNALVGFAAYRETLKNPDGKVEDFLKYYNKSVVLLLSSLQRKEPQTIATLLTVLQLASIEEYLGDWINIMGHQKAALQMLTNLFTAETAMQSPIGRMTFVWYGRFDAFGAIMGGFKTAISREWYVAFVDMCRDQAVRNPDNVQWKLVAAESHMQLISVDMSLLYPRGHKGEMDTDVFDMEHDRITRRLEEWRANLDPALTDPAYEVRTFPNQKALGADDIVNPYAPGVLYRAPIFSTTLLMSSWHSVMVMHKSQSSAMPSPELYGELRDHAYAICQIFEAVERWDESPRGAILLIQACVALSALFLPQDERHHRWIRRKLALMETMGHIHPATLRSKMGDLFGDSSCARWWLPNDEKFTPILQSIRAFADERNAVAVTAQMENLREMNHVFAKLQLTGD